VVDNFCGARQTSLANWWAFFGQAVIMSEKTNESMDAEKSTVSMFVRRVKLHPAYRAWKWPLDVVTDSVPATWRLATQTLRHLPTVVIVGAMKGGTTQLYSYLAKHPRVFEGAEKEVDYFSKHPERSIRWYRSRFPWRRRVLRKNGHVIEASPSYLPTPRALRQMKNVVPDARVIVLLRDPVSRAFSHYQHYKTRHRDSRSFEQAVAEELAKKAFPAKRGVALAADVAPMLEYVARGYYALQLELLYTLYPRNRVLVIDSANLFDDTNAVCDRVFDFLGLESFDVEPSKVYNKGFYKEKIDSRVAERLREHYRPYDELLTQLVGQPFRWMAPRAQVA
jgi:hypothetical protein